VSPSRRSEAPGLQAQRHHGGRHLLLEAVEVLGRAPEPGLQLLQQPEIIHLLEEVVGGRGDAGGRGGSGWTHGQRVTQGGHDAADAEHQALEAGAEVAEAVAQLGGARLPVQRPQVAEQPAVGAVVGGQAGVVGQAAPEVQVHRGAGHPLGARQPRRVEVGLIEGGAQVVQL